LASGWGSGAVEFPYLISPLEAIRNAFDDETVYVTDYPINKITKPYKAVQEIVNQQDLCMVFINSDGGEGYISSEKIFGDRNNLLAQKGGDQLATYVGNHCGNGTGDVIVVIHSIGPVLVENFADLPNVKAILYANLPGQESGNALVDVLFGDMSPCGALPYTVGKNLTDYGPGAKIMMTSKELVPQQNFSEGLFIDYRYFDYHNITPRYEFGFGLTYTRFHLSGLMIQRKIFPKTALPKPRPYPPVEPPKYDGIIPDPKDAVFPEGFRKLKKYIYPYISSASAISPGEPQYPPGSGPDHPSTPSQAGGASGGNLDLYTVAAEVSALIANIGDRDSSVVVQLYVRMPQNYKDEETGEEIVFPVRQLRNWEKVFMKKGDSRRLIKMELTRKDLSYWSPTRQNWVMPTLTDIGIELGFSSRDIKLRGTF
jgi:beta-glucosidase